MNVKWYLSDTHACGYVRAEVLARETNKAKACRMDCKTEILISDYYGTDLMVFQRGQSVAFLEKMRLAKAQGIKTVYEVDDDLLNTPKEFKKPYEFYRKKETRDIIKAFLAESDAITVSTNTLGKAIKDLTTKPIFVIENNLDIDMWSMAYAQKQRTKDDKITIGWMASGSHAFDAYLVEKAILKIMQENENVHLHMIGWVGWEALDKDFKKMEDRITVEEWIDISVLPMYMANFDIGIAACCEHPFNDSKSAIKAFQYWALGIPVVASPIPEYENKIEHGKDGFICEEGEWYGRLNELVMDKEKRELMGAHGRFKLLSEYDIKMNVGQWTNVFDMICGI